MKLQDGPNGYQIVVPDDEQEHAWVDNLMRAFMATLTNDEQQKDWILSADHMENGVFEASADLHPGAPSYSLGYKRENHRNVFKLLRDGQPAQ